MIDLLRAKPHGDEVQVAIGDYRATRVEGTYSVVALVFNNIFDPRGRPAQLDLFRNAAHHLEPGGCFVIEAFVLTESQRRGDWSITPRYVGAEHVELQLSRYQIATNQIERTFVHLRPQGLDFFTVADAYAAPGELDVMAEVTGFKLAQRFSSWTRDPFTAVSTRHVSVYDLIDR